MEEAAHIFDNLDTPSISPVTIDEELAPEFEPLAKGTRPVKTVQGNMVCADMRLVCAFDSEPGDTVRSLRARTVATPWRTVFRCCCRRRGWSRTP